MNRISPFAEAGPSQIDLAFEPDFNLGGAVVRPSRQEVLIGERCQVLEPRQMQVLVALGRSAGETVTREELIQLCWEGRFVSDDAVNRAVSKIRSLAQLDGGASFRIETRPRVGYRLFQGDAVGDKSTKSTVLEVLSQPSGARSRVVAVVAGAATLIGAAGVLLLGSGEQAGPLEVSLAGFTSLSLDLPATLGPSTQEELLTAFGVDDAVIVTSGENSGGSPGFRLDGTLRRIGDDLRFTLRLENRRTGAVLLTENFDRPLAHIAVAPRQAAVSLSQVARCGLSAAARDHKLSDRTLALYFQFCQELWSGSIDNNGRALHVARRVTATEPDFARGWSGLAAAAGYLVRSGAAAEVESVRAEGMKAADKALRLDPQNSQAWAAKGNLLPMNAFAEREAMYLKAISARPTDCSCERQDYGHFLASTGRWAEAIEQFRRGYEMQPLGATANSSVAASLSAAGRDDEARPIIEKAISIWPDRPTLRRVRLRMALASGRYDDGVKLITDPEAGLTSQERSAWAAAFEALSSGDRRRRDSAAAQIVRLTRGSTPADSFNVAALGMLGHDKAALDAAERMIGNGASAGVRVLFEPAMARARHDLRFAALVQKLGLVRYWRESRQWPDFCNDAGAPALCGTLEQSKR